MVTEDTIKRRDKKQQWYFQRRQKAMIIYGGQCQECGETMPLVLVFHHRNGYERDAKGKLKENRFQLLNRIVNSGKVQEDIQLLCQNCHELANIRDGTSSRVYKRSKSTGRGRGKRGY